MRLSPLLFIFFVGPCLALQPAVAAAATQHHGWQHSLPSTPSLPSAAPLLHAQCVSPPMPAAAIRLRGGTVVAAVMPHLEPAVVGASLRSVTELLTCCGLGVAARKAGIIDGATTRALARCVYNVFLPSMLCTSVASTIAAGAGWALLPIPLTALLQVGLGLMVAAAILKISRVPLTSVPGRDVAALSAFGNAGVLPLIFADTLFRSQPAMLARANSYVAMYLLGWSPLFWTLGLSLLANQPPSSAAVSDEDARTDAHVPKITRTMEQLRQRVLTPPIVGCLAGIVVGSVAPLRTLLVPLDGRLAPLPFHRCLSVFAKAYSPAALLVLASSLAPEKSTHSLPSEGEGARGAVPAARTDGGGDGFTIGVVATIRFVLLPLSFSCLLRLASHFHLLQPNPLRDFMLLLQATMPSAQNAVLALQVSGEPARASRMAKLLLCIYLIAALPVAGVLTLALQRSGLGAAVL